MFSILFFLVVVWLAVTVGLAMCATAIFWYEACNSPQDKIPTPGMTLLNVLKVFASTFTSMLFFSATRPFGFRALRKPAQPGEGVKADLPPVILVHGLCSSAASWFCLGRGLKQAGYGYSTYCFNSCKQSVDEIVDGLQGHVATMERHYPGLKPVIVAHSVGGLLARRWMALEGNEKRVAGLITLGAPHEGSKLAALGKGKLVEAVRPEGALTVSLHGAPAPQTACVSLASPVDATVLPAASLVPPQGWELRVTRPYGHFSMLYHKPVIEMVLGELQTMAENKGARGSNRTASRTGHRA